MAEAIAQYIVTVYDEEAREELQGKLGDLGEEFGSGALDYEVQEPVLRANDCPPEDKNTEEDT